MLWTGFWGTALDLPLQIHVVLLLGNPDLDAALQVWAHQDGAEQQNHLPWLSGHMFCMKPRVSYNSASDFNKQANKQTNKEKKK